MACWCAIGIRTTAIPCPACRSACAFTKSRASASSASASRHSDHLNCWGLDFVAVDQKDYRRLYKIALRCRRDNEPPCAPPVLPQDQLDLLWKNTIGYLEGTNLERIKSYGGRAKRGVLLTGAPGNGKTMACRWIWEACRQRRWEYRLVTPDNYRAARAHDNIEELFSVDRRGIVFFDDMDLALRDRDKVAETEDQAVFLGAMDGIEVNEGVVFVFTTNCSLDLIDRAFKRPGRLDLVLHFKPPDAAAAPPTDRALARGHPRPPRLGRGRRLDGRLQLRGDRGAEEPAGHALHGHERRGIGAGR